MGFFSWDCKKCGKSIRSVYSTDKSDAWMREAVVLEENGSIIKGEYDGYGRVGGYEVDDYDVCMYHAKCWEEAGKPEYDGPSDGAADQGFFIYED